MPDEPLLHDRDGIDRRQALWRLLGIALPVNFGLLWAPAAGMQLSRPRNLRISHNRGAGQQQSARPRPPPTDISDTDNSRELRAQIAQDGAFKARWQDAVSSFEAAGGYWAANSDDP